MKSLGPTRNRAYSWATKSQAPLYSSEVKVWTYQTTSANWPWCPVKRPSCSGNPCTRQEKQQKRRGCKSTRLRGQPVFQGWRCSVNFPKENIFSRDTADVVFFSLCSGEQLFCFSKYARSFAVPFPLFVLALFLGGRVDLKLVGIAKFDCELLVSSKSVISIVAVVVVGGGGGGCYVWHWVKALEV